MSPEDLSWNAIGQFEDEDPGSSEMIWERNAVCSPMNGRVVTASQC